MESSMHNVKILQSENPRVPTDRHQTSLSNSFNGGITSSLILRLRKQIDGNFCHVFREILGY
jgi:hypothetical protein